MLRPISRIQTHSYKYIYIYIYIYTRTNIISVQAKLEVVRRKHSVHLTGFGAYSSTCCKGTDNCAGTMGVDQSTTCTCIVSREMFNVLQSLNKLRWEDSNPWVPLQLAGSFSYHNKVWYRGLWRPELSLRSKMSFLKLLIKNIPLDLIFQQFCQNGVSTCHDSNAVLTCGKFCCHWAS